VINKLEDLELEALELEAQIDLEALYYELD